MICRRCGMESSTTDTCEWCKKPMLPPGGAISAKAKEEILKEKEEAAKQAAEPPPATRPEETELEAVVRRPEAAPPTPPAINVPGLTALGDHVGAQQESEPGQAAVLSTVEQTTNDSLLLPLGSPGTLAGGEATEDRTIYIGSEEEVVRPIERPSADGSKWVIDPSGRRRRVVDEAPEIPEKTRLFRATVHGSIVCMLMALIQFFVTKDHKVPPSGTFIMFPVPGGSDGAFTGALIYGIYLSALMGFMHGALLVTKKWGPVVGFLIGGVGLGVLAQMNSPNPPWTMITGAVSGIFVGRAAVKGVKRIVTV